MAKNYISHTATWALIFLLGWISFSCSNSTKTENPQYLSDNVPEFELKPGDTLVYQIQEELRSYLPEYYKYFIDAKFRLIGKGDTSLQSVDFNYLSVDWTWIAEDDTLRISTEGNGNYINTDVITNNTLNIEYELSATNSTNWQEFYVNIKDEINRIDQKPLEIQRGLYEFYNTMFHSNWIRAKVRQIFRFGPESLGEIGAQFEVGKKWIYRLPIQHEARSLHTVTNECTIDSIASDIIVANISGELYGQPELTEPKCVDGTMTIDRHRKVLRHIFIEQHMICDKIPSLNQHGYTNQLYQKTNKPHQRKKYDRVLFLEMNLVK